MEEFLANPGTEVVLVAELKDRQLVGFATLQITQSFCYTRPAAELTEIYVRPAHRRSGVGSLLVQEVVRRAESANVLELFLRVNRANSRAIAFYKPQATIHMDVLDFNWLASERITAEQSLATGVARIEGNGEVGRMALAHTAVPY